MKIKHFAIFAIASSILASCGVDGKKDGKFTDTPNSGQIVVASDESFRPIIDSEISAFSQLYRDAKVSPKYISENEAIQAVLNDSARVAMVTRELTSGELKVFEDAKIKFRSFPLFADGIALISNKANKDTLITLKELEGIMRGTKKKWSEIGKGGSANDVVLVFDKSNSSNLSFLMQKFGISAKEKVSFYAVNSNLEVITYVKEHQNSLGVIGNNWISDGDDAAQLGFIRSINVMSVSAKDGAAISEYLQPFGYNLALKTYPLRREIKAILKEPHNGLGTSFINYLGGDAGQLIALKAGLIPLTRPINIKQVEINK